MPDESVDGALGRVRVAATAARYQLLTHAAVSGAVKSREAASIAEVESDHGTAGWHLRKLVAAGLLEQSGRGTYILTADGETIQRALAAVAGGDVAPGRTERVMIVAMADPDAREALDRVVPLSDDLTALLKRRLADGDLEHVAVVNVTSFGPSR